MRRWDQFIRVWLCVSNFHWRPSSILGEGTRFTKSGFTRVFSVLATSIPIRKSDRNRPRLSLRLAPVRASFPRSAVCENMSTASAVCLYERIHWSFCITYPPNAPREPRERHGSTISTPENTCYGFHQCVTVTHTPPQTRKVVVGTSSAVSHTIPSGHASACLHACLPWGGVARRGPRP